MNSYRISSNLTLLFKLGIPIFWSVFFGAMTLGLVFAGSESFAFANVPGFKWVALGFYMLFLLIMLFFFLPLKRIELSEEHVYASNYFKTYRYPFEDVEKISSIDFGIILILKVHLKSKGQFGKKLSFLASKSRLKAYLEEHNSESLISALKQ